MKQKLFSFCSRMMLLMALVCLPKVVLADELTVNDGTSTNSYVPIYGNYFDYGFRSQFVIPASDLVDMVGGSISSMKFYSSDASSSWSGATYKITLLEVPVGTKVSAAFQSIAGGVEVFNGMQNIAAGVIEITFSNEFSYQGEDLLVETSSTGGGSYATKSFRGANVTGGARYASGSAAMTAAGTAQSFSPKVTFEYTPGTTSSCAKPSKPFISDVLDASATATWAAADDVSSYQYLIVAQGADLDWSTAVTTQDTTVSLTGLNANTAYTFAVRSYCGAGADEQSNPQRVNFRTACGVITSLPWNEDFESYASGTFNDPCWTNVHTAGSSTDLWKISSSGSTYSPDGGHGLQMGYQSSGNKVLLATPEIVIPNDGNEYEFSFWMYRNSYHSSYPNELVRVLYNSEPSVTGAVLLEEIHHGYEGTPIEAAAGWYKYAYTIPAGNVHILLDMVWANGYSMYIDKFQVREMPSCRPSKDLHFESSELQSATFAWTPANGETEWQLQYKSSSEASYSTANLTSPSFTLESLEKGTYYTYNFILHSVCDGALSPDSTKYTIKFGTQCEQIEADTVRFDAELTEFTPCYDTYVSKGTNTSKWQTTTTPHSGARSFYVYGYSYSNSAAVLALPEFSLGENQQLTFWTKAGTANVADSIIVKLVHGTDTTAIYTVKDMTTAWTEHRVDLSAYARDENYRLLLEGYNYYSLYVDDIVITGLPDCQPISALGFAGVAQSEDFGIFAKFTWTAGGEEEQWHVIYRVKADTVGGDFDEPVDDYVGLLDEEEIPGLIVPELEPNTKYIVELKVSAACEEEVNESSETVATFSFKTPCLAAALPYEENFNDLTAGIPDCWDNSEGTTSTELYKFSMNTSGYNSSKCVGFDSYNNYTDNTNFLKTPQIAASEDARFSFKWCNATGGDLSVYYSIDGGDMVLLKSGMKSKSTWTTETFDIPESQGHMLQFIFKGTSNYGTTNSRIRIDDVAVSAQPSCIPVRNLGVDSIATDAARIAWTPGKNETEWSVVIKKGSAVVLKDTIDVPYVLIDTLSAGTSYSFKVLVKAMCDGVEAEDFLPEQTLTFTTECLSIAELPWTEGFETATTGSGNLPLCWKANTYNSYGTIYPYVSSTAHTGSKGLYFYGGNDAKMQTAILPIINADLSNARMELYSRSSVSSASSIYGKLIVGYMTNVESPATFVALDTLGQSSDFVKSIVLLENVPAGARLAIRYAGGVYEYGYAYIDDVTIETIPSCLEPTNLRVVEGSVGTTTVAFTWDSEASKFEVTLGGTTTYLVEKDTAAFTGLDEGITYAANLSVRAICADGDTSKWSPVTKLTFTTECTLRTLPFAENFNSISSGIPGCWDNSEGTTTDASYKWNYYATGYDRGCARFNSYSNSNGNTNILATPSIVMTEEEAELTFMFKNPTGGDCKLQISTDDGVTKTDLLTNMTGVSTWTSYTVNLAAYAGDTVKFYFVATSNYGNGDAYIYLDDFRVREIPTCFPGTNLHVIDSAKTTSSVKFGWTPYSEENLNAHIIVKNGEDTIANALVNDSAYVLTGLEASKIYTLSVQVNTVCGEIESTDALVNNRMLAETDCAVISSLPWREDFENQTDLSFNKISNCWVKPSNMTSISENPHFNDYYSDVMEGKKCLTFNSDQDSPYCISMPQVDLDLDTVELSFLYMQDYAGETYASLHIGVMSDPTDSATYIDVATIEQFTEKTLVDVLFTNVPATHKYIAFYMPTYRSPYHASMHYIDNVDLHVVPTCYKPADFHVKSVGLDTAVIAWSGDASQYQLALKLDTAKAYDTLTVNDTCYVIRGLNHSTVYSYNVMARSICAEGDTSIWSQNKKLSFTTECAPVATLPWSENFDADKPNMICWKLDAGVSAAISNSYAKSGTGVLKFNELNDTILAVLPEFVGSLSDLQFDYNWRCESTSNTTMGYLEAGYVTDVNDKNSFVQLANHPQHKYTYQTVQMLFPNNVPDGARIAFRYHGQTGNYWLFVDDIEVKLAPTCKKVMNLQQDTLTANSVRFGWTPVGEETEWIVAVYKDTTRLDSVVVNTPSFSIDTLLPETAYGYTIKVKASCGEGLASEVTSSTFNFTTNPTCFVPTGLSVKNVGLDTAVVVWKGDAGEYQLVLKASTAANADTILVEGDTCYVIRGLQHSKNYSYSAKVRAICQEGDSSKWTSATLSFATECQVINSLPWVENFNSLTSGIPACWDNSEGTTTYASYKWNYENGYLKFNSYSNSKNLTNILKTPEIELGSSPAELSFKFKNPTGGALKVQISVDGAAAVDLLTTGLNGVSTWTEKIVDLSAYANHTVRILFHSTSNYGSGDAYHYLDDVKVRKVPTCFPATAIHAVDSLATTTSATIAWNAPVQGGSQYKVLVKNDTTVLVDNVLTTDTFAVVSGLNPSATYTLNVSVTTVCGEGDESEAAEAILSVATLCEVISTFPWSEDFENLISGIPACWDNSEGTTTTDSYKWNYRSDKKGVDDSKCLSFNSYNNGNGNTNILATPTFNLTRNAILKFQAKNPSGGTPFKVQIAVDGGAKQDLVNIGAKSAWTAFEQDLSEYTGHSVVIYFYSTSNYGNGDAYHYLDNVEIVLAPTCFPVSAIHAVDSLATTTSATIAWTAPAQGANQYKVLVKNDTTVLVDNALTADTFAVVEGLNPSSVYSLDVTIVSMCDDNEESEAAVATVSAKTLCGAIASFPWSEDFELAADGVVAETVPCFGEEKTPAANSWTVATSVSSAHNGSKYASCAFSSTYSQSAMVLPEFNLSSNKVYTLTYWVNASEYADADSIYVVVNDDCISQFNTEACAGEWTEVSAQFSGNGLTTIKIVYVTNDGYSVNLDDLRLEEQPYIPTGMENGWGDKSQVVKILRDNQVYILRDGVLYDIVGRRAE